MGRAPCCEKMGLKKGPWSPEEDRILISYIENFGHANWRALPKQAGLLRCGKSCRLRWMNYLRPDIKRGNFSREEEENIIKLHELLGNRWSAIAARLPGRTDNEIKNVWHTHLKKRLKQSQEGAANLDSKKKSSRCNSESKESPQPSSSSDFSSLTDASNAINMEELMQSSMELLPPIDESFWSDISSLPAEYSPIYDEKSIGIQIAQNFPASSGESNHLQFPPNFSNVMNDGINSFSTDDGMDFWCELFINSGEIPEF